MEAKTLENEVTQIIEKFYPCEITTQKSQKGDDELIVDFTVQVPDRDKEILLVPGAVLDNYRKNPIIQADHSFSVRSTVGSAKWVKAMGDSIRIAPSFAKTQFAQDVKSLVEDGHLKTVSHTFKGYSYEEDETKIGEILKEHNIKANAKDIRRVYTKWEPLEVSWVTIPSNTEAMVKMIEEGVIKTKSLIDSIQSISTLDEYLEKKTQIKAEPKEEKQIKVSHMIDEAFKKDKYMQPFDSAAKIVTRFKEIEIELKKGIEEMRELLNSFDKSVQGEEASPGEQGVEGEKKISEVIGSAFETFKTPKGGD